ncbi:MAG: hypothetical protein NTY32_01825, partial [Bacteroidia bacterium]|nr:hypothetical protein [Bacteroidia bacterium]
MKSKYTIVSPVKDSADEYLIVNPLYGSADVISAEEKERFLKELDPEGAFAEKGYLTQEFEERAAFRNAYLDFLDRRETDEIQLFFVPNYSCNFACTYCYQEGYEPVKQVLSIEVIDA